MRTACCLPVLSFQLLGFVKTSNELLWRRRCERADHFISSRRHCSEDIIASRDVDVSIPVYCLLYCNFSTRAMSKRL